MKINKNSWHYKLNEKFMTDNYLVLEHGVSWDAAPVTLCSYFWSTAWAAFQVALALLLSSLILFFAFGALYALLLGPLTGFVLGSKLAVAGFVTWAYIAIGYAVSVGYRLYKRPRRSKSEKDDGLVAAFIKAKKAKFCPIVELEVKR